MNNRISHPFGRLLVAFVAVTILATSCSDGEEAADETPTGSSDATITSADDTDGDPSTTATTEPVEGDDESSTSTTDTNTGTDPAGGVDAGELPGDEWDGFASAGDEFAVMGVAHDDELNVRLLPDASSEILTSVGPTETGLIATGRARMLPASIWYEIDVDGMIGWVNASFVGFMGGTDDATADYLTDGSQGGAETMVDLARAVSAAFASEEPESRIVQSVAPTVGDLGEITYDVIGLGDDSVAGMRLHIFATPDENGETFSLKSIERTVFCSRGTDGELCT